MVHVPAAQCAGLYNRRVDESAGPDFQLEWKGTFSSSEANALHAEAFGTTVYPDEDWDWWALVERHSLGWVVARRAGSLSGFVNVVWDGLVHAWLQDLMVAAEARGAGLGRRLVQLAADGARDAGCEWLHVDFDEPLRPFYLGACGFSPASAGLLRL